MIIISELTKKEDILANHNHFFKTLIKGVADVEKGILALDAELHADLEQSLLEKGSQQDNLWGINLYLTRPKEEWIEYTALINIRPSLDNNGMEVEDKQTREKIDKIVFKLVVF